MTFFSFLQKQKDALIQSLNDKKTENTNTVLEIVRLNESIKQLKSQISELGGRDSVEKEIHRLKTERDAIAKELNITEEDIKKYDQAVSTITAKEAFVEEISKEIKSISSLSSVVQSSIDLSSFSKETEEQIEAIVQKIIGEANRTWNVQKEQLIAFLSEKLKIAEKELEFPYKIQTYQNCAEHHYYFSHIVDMRYKVRRMGSLDKREEYIWIDIFPYDGLPDGVRGILIYLKLLFYRFCYHMAYFEKINIARKDRAVWQKIILQFLKFIYKVCKFDKDKWREKIDILLKKQNIEKCGKIMSFMGVKLQREIFPRKVYDDLVDYQFEDMNLKGPSDYDRVLKQMYGDYMSLPPVEKRVSHPMEIVECE